MPRDSRTGPYLMQLTSAQRYGQSSMARVGKRAAENR